MENYFPLKFDYTAVSGATALEHKSMSSRRQIQLADIILFGDADRWQTANCNPKWGFSLWLNVRSSLCESCQRGEWRMGQCIEG